ncbi:MAG: LUD domain-containing protein [Acidimicrobiia bacterium]|nr:LUD domain-containing protein [Acidimicrobiia bacterium]
MERAAFLARLQEALGRPAGPVVSAHPGTPAEGPAAAVYRRPLDDLAAAFTEEAGALGVQVRRVAPGGVPAFLAEVVAAHGVRSAVVSRDPEAAGAAAALQALGVRVDPFDGPATAAAADLGVTGAVCGIAATGSIVVATDRAGGRSASLLPPVHAALVPVGALLATPAGLWRRLDRVFPGGLSSQVVVITGPSRTGDIELVLVRGVHGPGHVWVGLLEQ